MVPCPSAWHCLIEQRRQGAIWQKDFVLVLCLALAQAAIFQQLYYRKGKKRLNEFDAPYKEVFDAAVATSQRPIYLSYLPVDAYIHAYWYGACKV